MRKVYGLLDHACRICLGRVLSYTDEDGVEAVECAECGTKKKGTFRELCACGQRLMSGKNAGFKCVKNAAVTPESPNQIIVFFEGEM